MAIRKSTKSLYPPPVIVGFFGQGEQIRLSFWQPAGKPWRFAAVVPMIKQIIGDERYRTRTEWKPTPAAPLAPLGVETADDLLCYFIEWNGTVYRDEPQPSPSQIRKAKREQRQRERDPARKRVVIFKPKAKPKVKRPKRRAA